MAHRIATPPKPTRSSTTRAPRPQATGPRQAAAPRQPAQPVKSPAKPFQPGTSGDSAFTSLLGVKVDLGSLPIPLPPPETVDAQLKSDLGLSPYPSGPQRAAREKEIDASVSQMQLSGGARHALAMLAREHVSPVDIWQGSHCIAQGDGGKLYERLSKLPGVEARASSHYPGVKTQQYGLEIGGAELLFGRTGDGSTWFQMEAHPFHGGVPQDQGQINDDALHLLDYAKYRAVNQNIGPLGTSPHTEHQDPIVVG